MTHSSCPVTGGRLPTVSDSALVVRFRAYSNSQDLRLDIGSRHDVASRSDTDAGMDRRHIDVTFANVKEGRNEVDP